MAEDNDTTIAGKLEAIEQHAHKLVEAGKRNDWKEAEEELQRVRNGVLGVTRFIERAHDIQRGQIR